jgi:UDPglucose 6-dehydrogenase
MAVGVIGLGSVGRAVERLFVEAGYEVVGWDVADGAVYPREELGDTDFCVISVDTPTVAGRTDLSSVEEAVGQLPCERILLKSTVPPGTTERLSRRFKRKICFWPEYIGQSQYHNPYFASRIADVPFVVLGGVPEIRQWFIDQLLPVLGPTKTYFQCASREAELIKYAENAYFATKVTFVNELRRIAEAFGADWHTVREGWLLDPRVEPMHTAAFAASPGFSGRCLPKDLEAIVGAAQDAGYDPDLLAEVLRSNERIRGSHEQPN